MSSNQEKDKHIIAFQVDKKDHELIKKAVNYERSTMSDFCRRNIIVSARNKNKEITS